jgi:hypothetical protein
MARRQIATQCSQCGTPGWRQDFPWMSHADFCRACMDTFVAQGWAVHHNGPVYVLTPLGEQNLPQHRALMDCPTCGTPIYARWVEEGIARADDGAGCPHCLDLPGAVRPP